MCDQGLTYCKVFAPTVAAHYIKLATLIAPQTYARYDAYLDFL